MSSPKEGRENVKNQEERTSSTTSRLGDTKHWMIAGMLTLTTGMGLGCSSSPAPSLGTQEGPAKISSPSENVTDRVPSGTKVEPGVAIPTSTGLIFEEVVEGDGPQPLLGQRLQIRYTGRLQEDGPPFDKGTMDYDPIRDKTIRGWLIGIAGNKEIPPMRVGGIRKLTIPPHLGYGGRELPNIPPNSTLLFEVQLVRLLDGSASPSNPFSAP
jgi:hypothetical protein